MSEVRVRARDGETVLTLADAEVEVLADLAGQLAGLYEGGVPERGTDPVRERLFPRAHLDPTADEAEADWQRSVHDDLVQAKSEALREVVGALDGARARRGKVEVRLSPEAVDRWVVALNDARLALGVVLEVTDDWEGVVADDDPRRPSFVLYDWLTHLQGTLIETLMPEADD